MVLFAWRHDRQYAILSSGYLVHDIFAVEIYMTFILTFRIGKRLNVNMPIESQCWTFYLMVIVIFVLSVIVYKIFADEMCTTLDLVLYKES